MHTHTYASTHKQTHTHIFTLRQTIIKYYKISDLERLTKSLEWLNKYAFLVFWINNSKTNTFSYDYI